MNIIHRVILSSTLSLWIVVSGNVLSNVKVVSNQGVSALTVNGSSVSLMHSVNLIVATVVREKNLLNLNNISHTIAASCKELAIHMNARPRYTKAAK